MVDRLWAENVTGKGMAVDEVYSLRRKELPVPYANGYRFRAVVSDVSGELHVNYWGSRDLTAVQNCYEGLREGALVRVKGISSCYREQAGVNVNPSSGGLLEIAATGDYDPADFVPRTNKDQEEMFSVLWSYINSIEDVHLHALLESIFLNNELAERFKSSPASVSFHCAWIGGLLEHTLNVVRLCDSISRLYPALDRDLLIASAILHDVGKVRCYVISTSIAESIDGRMMGHLVIGANMVREACQILPDFPETLRLKVIHMVLASHGTNEKGSPTEPSIPEALVLNYADELDARVERFILAREQGGPGDLFVIDRPLGTKVFLQ